MCVGIVTEALTDKHTKIRKDKEREIQMYLVYHRDDDDAQQEGSDWYKVQSDEKKKKAKIRILSKEK